MSFAVASIVEGDGEVAAFPVLLRALKPEWKIERPIRVSRGKLLPENSVNQETLSRYLRLATQNILEHSSQGAIIILVDAESACPKTVGAEIKQSASALRVTGLPVFAVLPKCSFETWFLASDPVYGDDHVAPESVQSPSNRVRRILRDYGKTADQPKLTAKIDIDLAKKHSRSFRRLLHVIELISEHEQKGSLP